MCFEWVLEIVWGGECVEKGGCGEDWTGISGKKKWRRIFPESWLCQEVKTERARLEGWHTLVYSPEPELVEE